MTILTVLGVIAGGFVLFLVGMQVFLVLRVRRQRGRPVPELAGRLGRAARDRAPSLFYFHSPACGPCRAMTPMVRKLPGFERTVFEVDVTRDMETARRFGVMATPTTVVVQAGVVRDVRVGPQSEATLKALLA